jgi:ubiquinone/menaquinone biosynthesis C-methylase UbiE
MISPVTLREGWRGWDEYAPFYDWENTRTIGRADVPFWRRMAEGAGGRVLELGCGTGRVTLPLVRAGATLVGIDRSQAMLTRAIRGGQALRRRTRGSTTGQVSFVRGDIRALPFRAGEFAMVMAPYGVLQSLLRERDLASTLDSVARVLETGGLLAIDLVPDVPNWSEYENEVKLRGRGSRGARLTLVESVRQNRRGRLTTFEQRYVERRGRRVTEHTFELVFRTLPVSQMTARLNRAGFAVDAMFGDYGGQPWDEQAKTWILVARRQA